MNLKSSISTSARCTRLQFGNVPVNEGVNAMQQRQNVKYGLAGANSIPLFASNRINKEVPTNNEMNMIIYDTSFIADHESRYSLTHTFNLDDVRSYWETWAVIRDG